jgi:hypothetical protein
MLERLAGRLRWEQTSEGIRVAIPTRRGTLTFFYGPLVVIWLIIASFYYWRVLEWPLAEASLTTAQLAAIGLYIFGFLFFIGWLAVTFSSDTMVSLDGAEMKIQRRVLGVEFSSRIFPTGQVSQLVYVPPGKLSTSKLDIDPNTTRIQFRTGDKTHSFAKGITQLEAGALILLMLQVYKFQDSVAPVVFDGTA